MTRAVSADAETLPPLPMAEARLISRRFMYADPKIYWPDFLISIAVGWGAFAGAVMAPMFSALQFALIIVSALAHLRGVLFTHELAHMKKGTFIAFRFVWNALSGMPFLVPSYSYTGVHLDHHRPGVYGSSNDGEYVSFGAGAPWRTVGYVLLSFVLPPLLVLRFLILTPLSWIVRPLRKVIWRHLSSLAIDLSYDRPPQNKDDDATWLYQETATTLFVVAVAALMWKGIVPLSVLWVWYATTTAILIVNAIRTLGAHAYRYKGEAKVNKQEEYQDSVNVPSEDILSKLIAPVGLRFHATHHLFPATPYHNLPKLHAALEAELSDNRSYMLTARKSYLDALRRLWADAAESDRKRAAATSPSSNAAA